MKPYDEEVPGPHPPCPECGDETRRLRTQGPHIYECCGNGHKTHRDWLGQEHFAEGGDRYGQLPPEDFDKKKRKRAKRVTLIEHIAVETRMEEVCFFCRTPAFKGPRQAKTVREWLKAHRPGVYARLLERFKKRDGTDMVVFPQDWPAAIKDKYPDFYEEIHQELTFSTIEADHLVLARLIELLSPDRTTGITAKMLEYGGRRLAVPTCQKCNRGRHLAGQESPDEIMELWTAYYFDRNRAAAKADPRYRVIELLATVAYRIDQDFKRLKRQRPSDEEN